MAAFGSISQRVFDKIVFEHRLFIRYQEFELDGQRPFASMFGHKGISVLSSIRFPSATLMIAAMVALFRFKVGMLLVLGACSAAGMVYDLATGAAR